MRVFCTSSPATTAMVVGREAAHTPSRFNVFSSIPDATTREGHTEERGRERGGTRRRGRKGRTLLVCAYLRAYLHAVYMYSFRVEQLY